MAKKKNYTAYCQHSFNCDKDIDCFNGESCQFFEHTNFFSSIEKEVDLKQLDEDSLEPCELNFGEA